MHQVLWKRTATRNGRLLRVSVLLLMVISLTLFFSHQTILTQIANYLVVADPLEHADAIAVLGGDVVTRCRTAANLFSQGWANRILITKEGYAYEKEKKMLGYYGISELEPHEKCFLILTFFRVPERTVEVMDGYNESTADEARKLRQYLYAHGMKRVIVVTSNFHSRRARMLFRRVLRGTGVQVTVQAAPASSMFDPNGWWTRRRDSKTLLWEYQKLFFYAFGYW